MSENKTGKYLKYAVGEIFLVVIGILIAIQINTYYNDRNDQNTLINQLENVASEIDGNIDLIDSTIEKSTNIIDAGRSLAENISTRNSMPPKELSALTSDSFSPVLNYQPNMELLNEMIASGFLRDLKNNELSHMLLGLQANLAELKNQESLHAADQARCTEFLLEHGDFRAMMDDLGHSEGMLSPSDPANRKGNQALLRSKEFENKLLLFIASGIGLQRGYYVPHKASLETIREAIDVELRSYH